GAELQNLAEAVRRHDINIPAGDLAAFVAHCNLAQIAALIIVRDHTQKPFKRALVVLRTQRAASRHARETLKQMRSPEIDADDGRLRAAQRTVREPDRDGVDESANR